MLAVSLERLDPRTLALFRDIGSPGHIVDGEQGTVSPWR
jgi:hypothetical protein